MIPDHANPAHPPSPVGPPEPVARPLQSLRSCELHADCDVAEARARRQGSGSLVLHPDEAVLASIFF